MGLYLVRRCARRPSPSPPLPRLPSLPPTMWTHLSPSDERLSYSNYLHLHRDADRAVFDRCFDDFPSWPCGWLPLWRGWAGLNLTGPYAEQQNPGATIAVRTDATQATMTIEYTAGGCSVGCPTSSGTAFCYIPSERGDSQPGDACDANCLPLLYVDGVRTRLPPASAALQRRGQLLNGHVSLELLAPGQTRALRTLELVMPWGGPVVFRGIELRGEAPLTVRAPPPKEPFTYVAYGDSITHGFCAETPCVARAANDTLHRAAPPTEAPACARRRYPELVGRMNNWNSINLGWGGIPITPRHGPVIGSMDADLVSVLIGTNDWGTSSCDISDKLASFLRGIREAEDERRPPVPIVVITLIERRHGHEARGNHCSGNARYTIEVRSPRQPPRARRAQPRRARDVSAGSSRADPADSPQLRSRRRPRHVRHGGRQLAHTRRHGRWTAPRCADTRQGAQPEIAPRPRRNVHASVGSCAAMEKMALGINAFFHSVGLADTLVCYAERYPELKSSFCRHSDPHQTPAGTSAGRPPALQCDWGALQQHWSETGRDLGYTLGCDRPPRPPSPPPWPSPPPRPPPTEQARSGTSNQHCSDARARARAPAPLSSRRLATPAVPDSAMLWISGVPTSTRRPRDPQPARCARWRATRGATTTCVPRTASATPSRCSADGLICSAIGTSTASTRDGPRSVRLLPRLCRPRPRRLRLRRRGL